MQLLIYVGIVPYDVCMVSATVVDILIVLAWLGSSGNWVDDRAVQYVVYGTEGKLFDSLSIRCKLSFINT